MKQPKFKFGDKVSGKDRKNPWVIKGFYSYDEGKTWLYIRGDEYLAYDEKEIELYQEPQKKKLYAYTMNGAVLGETNEVRFYKKELDKDWKAFIRAPEYDIEYNAEALCKEQENTERR